MLSELVEHVGIENEINDYEFMTNLIVSKKLAVLIISSLSTFGH